MTQLTEEQQERVRQIRERQRQRRLSNFHYDTTVAVRDVDELLSLLDSDSQAAEPDYRPDTMNAENEKAPKRIWVNNPAEVTEHDQRWWYGNEMAFPTVEYVRADLLATARKEAFESAYKVLCPECAGDIMAVFDEQARWYYHGEGRVTVGCSASKLRIAALERAAEGEPDNCSGCVPVRAGIRKRCSIHGLAATTDTDKTEKGMGDA